MPIAFNSNSTTAMHQPRLYRFNGPAVKNIEVNPIYWGPNKHEQYFNQFYAHTTPHTTNQLDDDKDIKPFLRNLVKNGVLTPDTQYTYRQTFKLPDLAVARNHVTTLEDTTQASTFLRSDLESQPTSQSQLDRVSRDYTVATNPLSNIAQEIVIKDGLAGLNEAAKYLSWYDFNPADPSYVTFIGEVADLCEFGPNLGMTVGGDSHSYVALIWSNEVNACVAN
ncbi:UNVERIFIED_CONTAM: hypothetical protein HDU68_012181 [Siphonaria sp. JEL0065]|nr:hypothetical protein HDU68_012181 [Siphonaria sp. JEL0065]